MSKTESEWLAGAQLAKFLSVTTMTIWRWERDPKLEFPQPTIIRDRKYWNRDDINAWMRRTATSKAGQAERVA
jgi:predicted DNA-binding transcriptional regulator AlpA